MTTRRVLVLGDGVIAREIVRSLSAAGERLTSFVAEEPLVAKPRDRLQAVRELMQTVEMRTFDAVLIAFGAERDTVREIVREVERRMGPEALLLVSALGVSVTEAASWCVEPKRVVGFGYVPPLADVTCVEAASGLRTDSDVAERAHAMLQAGLGRDIVWVKDSVGLVIPRMVAMVINEAAYALQEGIAQAEDLDTAMKLGTNYPYGPLEWADVIGVEQVTAILQGLYAEQGEDRFRPAPLLKRLAWAGQTFYGRREEEQADARGGHY
ncbi:3-hydroxyacyl-CoA dehydrogenase family protein [Tumebacillus algifaecis]|nr:3-hydroxyacyl-CoA dehydrogenase family protein [Tumebacillus algifaecis]